MTDAGKFNHARTRATRLHFFGGLFQQQVGIGTAQKKRFAADRVPVFPQINVDKRSLAKGRGDLRVVTHAPCAVVMLPGAGFCQVPPLGVGQRPERYGNQAHIGFELRVSLETRVLAEIFGNAL